MSYLNFQFGDNRSALLAMDTLCELGYRVQAPDRNGLGQSPTLQVSIEKSDLTSALEIAAAYGGTLLEESGDKESQTYSSAYELDTVPIPAHVVAGDEPAEAADRRSGEGQPAFDPSESDYDHFPVGVRL